MRGRVLALPLGGCGLQESGKRLENFFPCRTASKCSKHCLAALTDEKAHDYSTNKVRPLPLPDPSSEQSPKKLRTYMELMEGDYIWGIGIKGEKRMHHFQEAIELGPPQHTRLRTNFLGPKMKSG